MTRLARTLRTVAAIAEATPAHRVARDVLAAHGYPSGGGTGSRGGSVADPTALTALAGDHSDAARAHALHHATDQLLAALDGYCAAVRRMTPTPVRDQTPAGVGNCQACNVPCVGSSDTDRLRGGLCNRCHQAWHRYQASPIESRLQGDRQAWIRTRQSTEWDDSHIEATAARHRRNPLPTSSAIGTMADIHQRLGSDQ